MSDINGHPANVYPEEIVVAGVSGRFPESENLDEFWKNLHDGVDMVTDDGRRWTPGTFDLPKRSGKLKGLDKFDATFFGVHPKQANFMDPQLRMLMEVTYEALVDAGVNPAEVRGTRTGVFIGASSSESEKQWFQNNQEHRHGYTLTGCQRGMFSNRISFAFDFQGPSLTVDTACSSSFMALEQAVSSIKWGHCDSAIVGGTHLCLEPETALQFHRLNMLSPDGKCKSFDAEGNGYVRSEAVVAIFIQKKHVARRSYASILAAKTNTDGFKEKGVTFPSGERQQALLEETYKEAGINPKDVVYVEAHGTGTPAGDPQELSAIVEVFAKNRNMTNPLLIGSIKSNIGHSEAASGLCGLAKVLLGFQNGVIPANLHFKNPNPNIPALIDGRLKVVSQNTPWEGGIVGLNSFGFGGANVHIILKSEPKKKDPTTSRGKNDLPLIIPFSGCTKKSVDFALKQIHNLVRDKCKENAGATVALLHQIFQENITKHQFRGFTVFYKHSEISMETMNQLTPEATITKALPVWFIFNGMGSQWLGFAKQLFKFGAFKESIEKSADTLNNSKIDLKNILFSDNEKILDDVTNSFVTITAVQIALVDLLLSLGIKPDGILGHSVGELGAAYADGCLTLKQTILAALARGQAITESPSDQIQTYGMAAVGLSLDETKSKCPPNIYPACHNAKDSVTISGLLDDVTKFVDQLKREGIFAKEVASSGRAFHSKYIEYARPKLKILLDEIIPAAKPRSSRWKSTSIAESKWDSDLAQTSSADYHVNNLISPVLFHEALCHVPESTVVIEIGPHCLLQSILKRSLPACSHIGLINKNSKDISGFLCEAIGKMFNCGLNPNFQNLYPPVQFPVSSSVPSLSPLILWDHEKSWQVANFDPALNSRLVNSPGQAAFEISLSKESDKFYADHIIDKRVLFPATGYLCLVWRAFAQLQNKPFDQVPVVFEHFKIERATIVPANGSPVKFCVNILSSCGEFELVEGGAVVVTGIVRSPNPNPNPKGNEFISLNERDTKRVDSIPMNKTGVYKEVRLRGNDSVGKFYGLVELDVANGEGKVEWLDNWVTFLDTVIQVPFLSNLSRAPRVPNYFDKVLIDPQILLHSIGKTTTDCDNNRVPVLYNKFLNVVSAGAGAGAVQFQRWKSGSVPLSKHDKISGSLKLERFQFTPYFDDDLELDLQLEPDHFKQKDETSVENFQQDSCLHTCVEIVLENTRGNTLKMVEIVETTRDSASFSSSLTQSIQSHVLQQPRKLFSGRIIVTDGNGKTSSLEKLDSEISVVTVENNKQVEVETAAADLIVLSSSNDLVKNSELSLALSVLKIQNFLLLHNDKNAGALAGSVNIQDVERNFGVVLVTQKFSSDVSFLLFRKRLAHSALAKTVVQIDLTPRDNDFNYDWVETLKAAMKLEKESKTKKDNRIYVVSRNSPDHPSGALGLINCLTKEPGGANIRCFFIQDDSDSNLKFDFDHPDEELNSRLQQDLMFNIYDSNANVWGSYRFFPLLPQGQAQCQPAVKDVEHGFVNIVTKGDLSSFQWFESPLKYIEPQADLVKVYFAALNFRDVMLCTGKLSPDSLPNNLGQRESVLGVEFTGKTGKGKNMMGFVPKARAFATTVIPDHGFLWDVPGSWTLEEAATIPVVFATAYYALLLRGRMREGESILIHSGAGGVGQAAISIALSMNCKVFITVSGKEKIEFLQKKFPQLDDSCFANSRDPSFLSHILEQTEGKGVDLVLNSLAGDLLQASVNCLCQHGKFLEIGKVDLFNNTKLGMSVLLKDVSVHGILLDSLVTGTETQKELWNLMDQGIKSGVVQPLAYTTFSDSIEEIERAFRFMASGKHVGKVLIKIRDENEESSFKTVQAVPRSYFDPSKSYIVVGGLGGFGLELCGWLVDRGVRKLVIVSRSGVKNGFQDFQIRKWREASGVSVLVSTQDVITPDGASSLLKTVLHYFNSPIGGIFNLAMVLRDGFMENQTPENFQVVSRPKVNAAMSLDKATRELAPSLEYFVVFTSIISGRGSLGLGNYAWANSASERICEQRRKSGFPALAIMWGAVGNVGVLQEGLKVGNDAIVGGTSPQPISSCLSVLDLLLHESKSPKSPVLASMVLPELQRNTTEPNSNDATQPDLSLKIAHILGLKPADLENVNANTALVDLGLDSLMQVEVKQLLEMTQGKSLSPEDVNRLTFGKIRSMQLPTTQGNTVTDTPPVSQVKDSISNETALKDNSDCSSEEHETENKPSELTANGTKSKVPKSSNIKRPPDHSLRTPTAAAPSGEYCRKAKSTILRFCSYSLGLVAIVTVLFFCFLSLLIRLFAHLHIKLFYPSNTIKILSRPFDQVSAANLRGSNMLVSLKFQGVPDKDKIKKTLQTKLVEWETNISLCNDVKQKYYKPYESLSWRLAEGFFFHYWTKVDELQVEDHLVFQDAISSDPSKLQDEVLRRCEFYHNYKWPEARPQWEFCVIAPKSNSLETELKSQEFYILFVTHHSYGDAFSFSNMVQHALCDSESDRDKTPSVVLENENDVVGLERDENSVNLNCLFSLPQMFFAAQNYVIRLHRMILEMSRVQEICRDYKHFYPNADSARKCGLLKFSLSKIKSIRNKLSGKRASVNAVVLTCTSRAYERIYHGSDKDKDNASGDAAKFKKDVKLAKNLVALMPFACFPQKRLEMVNNFSQSYTAVPTNIPDIDQRLNAIQKSIEDSSSHEKLMTTWDFTCLLSLLVNPISRFLIPRLSSPSLLFTSVPATVRENSTYFGGYRSTEFFGFTMLASRAHGVLSCGIDSVNDSVILSFVVDQSALEISPAFVDLFFQYFQDELESFTQD